MKNCFLIILIGIALLGCDTNKKIKVDLDKMNLKGNVKYVKEISSGRVTQGYEGIYAEFDYYNNYSFDREGQLIEESYDFGNEVWTEEYKYENNYLKEKIRYTQDENRAKEKHNYYYDQMGLLKEIKYSWDEGLKELRYEYHYNDEGQLIKKIEYDEYYYLDNDTTKKSISLFEYESNGNIVLENIYNGDWSHRFLRKKHYKDDLLVKENFKGGTNTYKYDKLGNEISEINAYDGYIPEEKKSIYSFDNNNNWIKKESLSEGYISIIKREIEYYP